MNNNDGIMDCGMATISKSFRCVLSFMRRIKKGSEMLKKKMNKMD